jgi:hypothetical protein
MTRYFTTYWKSGPWFGSSHQVLNHAASNQFRDRGVGIGDVLYVMHYEARELFLGGRLIVGRLLSQGEAEAHFDSADIWEARDHVLAQPGTEQVLNPGRQLSRELLRRLTFERPDGSISGLKFDSDGAANQQTLRGVREASVDSATILDQAIADQP